MWASRARSLQTYLELRPSYDPAKIYAEGAAKVVWVDYLKEKSVPLPENIRQLI
jgi:acyl-CoA thioester hydrolase